MERRDTGSRLTIRFLTLIWRFGPLLVLGVTTSLAAVIFPASLIVVIYSGGLPLTRFFVQAIGTVFLVSIVVFSATFLATYRADQKIAALKLRRASGSALDELLRRGAAGVAAPRVRDAFVTVECRVRVIPRRGRCDVYLGLPLIVSLEPLELEALVAHELAHYSGADPSRRSMYSAFGKLVASMTLAGPGAPGRAYAGIATALIDATRARGAQELTRHEQNADQLSARLVGPAALASALAKAALCERWVDREFWPALLRRHRLNPEPPDAYTQLTAFLRSRVTSISQAELAALIDDAEPGWLDTHPALGTRLIDLTGTIPTLGAPRRTADRDILPDEVAAVVAAVDDAWRESVRTSWHENYETLRVSADELRALDAAERTRSLTSDERLRRAALTEALIGEEAAVPLFEGLLVDEPNNGAALLALGRIKLSHSDHEGVALAERAAQTDEQFAQPAYRLIVDHLSAAQRDPAPYQERLAAAEAVLRDAVRERSTITYDDDRILAPSLNEYELRVVETHLRRFPQIKEAWLAMKKVERLPTRVCHVLGVRFKRTWWFSKSEDVPATFGAVTELPIEGDLITVDVTWRRARFMRPPGVLIYKAPPADRRAVLDRWGRRAQRAVLVLGIILTGVIAAFNSGCFPDCWIDPTVLLFVPFLVGINALAAAGADSAASRAVGVAASALFLAPLAAVFSPIVLPIPFVACMRLPRDTRVRRYAMASAVVMTLVGFALTFV